MQKKIAEVHTQSILIVLLVLIIILLSVFYSITLSQFRKQLQEINPNSSQSFPFLSKRIFVDEPNDQFVNFLPLREAINAYALKEGSSSAIYFEYLPSGVSIGINEKEELPIASLAKIPTIMKIYDLLNEHKINKTDTITLTENMLDNTFGEVWKMGAGATISIEEAINKTLIESDNTAHKALLTLLDSQYDLAVYNTLDIRLSKEANGSYAPYGSVKSISSIFKNLYFATYLSPEESNEILEKLTKSSFKNQLVAGTENTNVSHKIGVLEAPNGKKFFNDCGIIYYPRRNYVLCVFYSGEEEEANKQIAYISKMVYQYIKQISPQKRKQ